MAFATKKVTTKLKKIKKDTTAAVKETKKKIKTPDLDKLEKFLIKLGTTKKDISDSESR